MSFLRFGRIAVVSLVLTGAAALSACGGGGDDDPTETPPTTAALPTPAGASATAETSASPTRSPEATATRPATATPSPTATVAPTDTPAPSPTATPQVTGKTIGVASLDALAKAAESGNIGALASAVQYSQYPCTTTQGAGGPPKCVPGESEGTIVTVLPYAVCEGTYVRPTNVNAMLADVLLGAKLDSAFTLRDTGGGLLKGTYGVVFDTSAGGVMLDVNSSGQVVSVWRGCGASAEQIFESRAGSQVFLKP